MENTLSAAGKAAPPKDNIKETVESILVAFILAFVFRVFIVEAFVIPSGSMAPTLLGAHMRLRCQECGYDFTVNYPVGSHEESVTLPGRSGPIPVSRTTQDDDGSRHATARLVEDTTFSMHCPNCGFKVPRDTADPLQSARNTPVYFGDRILVLKYLYLLHPARRWDVVVFKSPYESKSDFTINYIKRLVGLPGETLMLLDGDVYTTLDTEGKVADRHWTIQTKPRHVQETLWRVVYDNDFHPANAGGRGWIFPWRQSAGDGWNAAATPAGPGRSLSFDNASTSGTLSFDADANPGTFPLTDWLAYDETKPIPVSDNELFPHGDFHDLNAYADDRIARWNVSDLKVQFVYQRTTGDGPLRVRLTKLGHEFTAELAPRNVSVYHTPPTGAPQLIGKAPLDNRTAGLPLFVEFSNIDYRVTLRVNDVDLVQTTSSQYQPDVRQLLSLYDKMDNLRATRASAAEVRAVFPRATVQIAAERQAMQLTHLSLWRDVYYTPYYHDGFFSAITNGSPDNPVQLSPGGGGLDREYFVLGDNSIMSGDARAWRNRVNLRANEDLEVDPGRVPDRFLLGKAFFVYWPAGYRPVSVNAPGIVPNFGSMRFIH